MAPAVRRFREEARGDGIVAFVSYEDIDEVNVTFWAALGFDSLSRLTGCDNAESKSRGRTLWIMTTLPLLFAHLAWTRRMGLAGEVTATLVVLLLVAAILRMAYKSRQVVEESVVAMRGLGLELRTRTRGGRTTTDFVEASQIKDIVIAEGLTMFDAFYYLSVEVQNSQRTRLPFQQLIPALPNLVHALHCLRGLLLVSE
ncbi:unnamed protein product, partial [Polarella glacialis]